VSSATRSRKWKFQISIPKDVRKAPGLKSGQKLAFINTGPVMRLVPQPAILDLVGIARGANTDNVRDREDRLERYSASRPAKAPKPKPRRKSTKA
jgi:bifunctional DNA-binding transcriptional regulator/antitoxin component of YhaV-PrlF toxin-antitoxin module